MNACGALGFDSSNSMSPRPQSVRKREDFEQEETEETELLRMVPPSRMFVLGTSKVGFSIPPFGSLRLLLCKIFIPN